MASNLSVHVCAGVGRPANQGDPLRSLAAACVRTVSKHLRPNKKTAICRTSITECSASLQSELHRMFDDADTPAGFMVMLFVGPPGEKVGHMIIDDEEGDAEEHDVAELVSQALSSSACKRQKPPHTVVAIALFLKDGKCCYSGNDAQNIAQSLVNAGAKVGIVSAYHELFQAHVSVNEALDHYLHKLRNSESNQQEEYSCTFFKVGDWPQDNKKFPWRVASPSRLFQHQPQPTSQPINDTTPSAPTAAAAHADEGDGDHLDGSDTLNSTHDVVTLPSSTQRNQTASFAAVVVPPSSTSSNSRSEQNYHGTLWTGDIGGEVGSAPSTTPASHRTTAATFVVPAAASATSSVDVWDAAELSANVKRIVEEDQPPSASQDRQRSSLPSSTSSRGLSVDAALFHPPPPPPPPSQLQSFTPFFHHPQQDVWTATAPPPHQLEQQSQHVVTGVLVAHHTSRGVGGMMPLSYTTTGPQTMINEHEPSPPTSDPNEVLVLKPNERMAIFTALHQGGYQSALDAFKCGLVGVKSVQVVASRTAPRRTQPNEHWCAYCETIVSGTANYEQHLSSAPHKKREAQPVIAVYYCSTCGIDICGEGNLSQHMEGMKHKRTASIKLFRCQDCGLGIKGEDNFMEHMQKKHGSR